MSKSRDVTYDIVLANGRVIDPESGLDAVRNVGIKADLAQQAAQFVRLATLIARAL
jgi:hypothetical protein